MADFALTSNLEPPRAPIDRVAVRIVALPGGHLLQALASPRARDVEARLVAVAELGPCPVRFLGPRQWLVVGDQPLMPDVLRAKAAALAPDVSLCDQSDGRTRFSVGGPKARLLLAKGCGVDFSPADFPLGRGASTLFGHIGLHVARAGVDVFELIVARSFADDFWDDLARQSADL